MIYKTQGPLWQQIRGFGYSYHYDMAALPDSNQLLFILSQSTHIFAAYKTAKEIVVQKIWKNYLFHLGQFLQGINNYLLFIQRILQICFNNNTAEQLICYNLTTMILSPPNYYHYLCSLFYFLYLIFISLSIIQEGYVSGQTPFEDSQLDSAKSGIMYQLISKEQTISSATMQVCLNSLTSTSKFFFIINCIVIFLNFNFLIVF